MWNLKSNQLTLSLRSFSDRFLTNVTATSMAGASNWVTTLGLKNSAQFPSGANKAFIHCKQNKLYYHMKTNEQQFVIKMKINFRGIKYYNT